LTIRGAYILFYSIRQRALEVLGFDREEVSSLFQLVASVLKLGNVGFKHRPNIDGTDGCQLINQEGLSDAV
jgi:myosin heavy subunit